MNQEIARLFEEVLNREFIHATISNPREKDGARMIRVRPIKGREGIYFQFEKQENTQVFHENLNLQEARMRLLDYTKSFKQMRIATVTSDIYLLVSKKGKITITKRAGREIRERGELAHNRTKSYLLAEGTAVPFLQDLGVMTADGRVVRRKYDKFRQINRFLEFIEDVLPHLPKDKELTIFDFGCGQSFLTFAIYHYLHVIKGYDCRIVGLDLKEDMVNQGNRLAAKYGYEKLVFQVGDIANFQRVEAVDMVVSLHACDTATDLALSKAVAWEAKVILAVPCCQHEINQQLEDNWQQSKQQEEGQKREQQGKKSDEMDVLAPILEYGFLRERFAAILTDGLRAEYLKSVGYDTQVLEFIPMKHTAKNVLLRGVKKGIDGSESSRRIQRCEEFLEIAPTTRIVREHAKDAH